MYSIINWDTNEVIDTAKKLSTAKRICRAQGHTGGHNEAYYAPVALVQDADGCCVYNPVFKLGRHDALKADNFVIAQDAGEGWQLVDTRGSLQFANILAKNVDAPVVAVFTMAQWKLDDPGRPRYLRDNRDRNNAPICGVEGLINSAPSNYF